MTRRLLCRENRHAMVRRYRYPAFGDFPASIVVGIAVVSCKALSAPGRSRNLPLPWSSTIVREITVALSPFAPRKQRSFRGAKDDTKFLERSQRPRQAERPCFQSYDTGRFWRLRRRVPDTQFAEPEAMGSYHPGIHQGTMSGHTEDWR